MTRWTIVLYVTHLYCYEHLYCTQEPIYMSFVEHARGLARG